MAMAICVLYGPARTSSYALPGVGAAVPVHTVALTILYPGAARGAQNFATWAEIFREAGQTPTKFYQNSMQIYQNQSQILSGLYS